jgi:hypothetical protein
LFRLSLLSLLPEGVLKGSRREIGIFLILRLCRWSGGLGTSSSLRA